MLSLHSWSAVLLQHVAKRPLLQCVGSKALVPPSSLPLLCRQDYWVLHNIFRQEHSDHQLHILAYTTFSLRPWPDTGFQYWVWYLQRDKMNKRKTLFGEIFIFKADHKSTCTHRWAPCMSFYKSYLNIVILYFMYSKSRTGYLHVVIAAKEKGLPLGNYTCTCNVCRQKVYYCYNIYHWKF